MRRGWKILIVLIALAGAGVAAWRFAYPSYDWRQKVTIEVETPQGVVTASSVAAVAWWGVPKILPEGSPRDWSVDAEATVLRLPDGRYLFALVGGAEFLARAVLFDPLPRTGDAYLVPASRMLRFKGEVHDIPPKHYPLLVTFTDIADPATVRRVDPQNLAASFGPGVALKRITLEITDEAVTEGAIERALPWLATIGGGMLDGARISSLTAENRLANDLSRLNFRRD